MRALLVALIVCLAGPASAADPFTFGWPAPGKAKVEVAEEHGPVKLRRQFDLVLEPRGDGYLMRRENLTIVDVDGPLTRSHVAEIDALLKPLDRPLYIDEVGRAVRVKAADPDAVELLRAVRPKHPFVAAAVRAAVEGDAVAAADADFMHLWNATVGYWVGRDTALARPVRTKLPDGRVMILEHLGPVADPAGHRHLSATVEGAKPGSVRGCEPGYLTGMAEGMKAAGASDAEVEHATSKVQCDRVEYQESVVAPDTLLPHLVVVQIVTTLRMPGREPTVNKSTIRYDFAWPKPKAAP